MFNWTLDKWINKATNEEKKLEKMLCIKYRLCWCRTKISSLNKVQTKNRRSGHRYILSNIQISLVDSLQNRPFKTLGCERTTTATTTTTAAIWKQREKKNSRKLKTNRKEEKKETFLKRLWYSDIYTHGLQPYFSSCSKRWVVHFLHLCFNSPGQIECNSNKPFL